MIPTKDCTHSYSMKWEVAKCYCTDENCGQTWILSEKGWRAVPKDFEEEQEIISVVDDPYKVFEANNPVLNFSTKKRKTLNRGRVRASKYE